MSSKKACTIITSVIAAVIAVIFFIRRKREKRPNFAFTLTAAIVLSMLAASETAYAKPFTEYDEYSRGYVEYTEYAPYLAAAEIITGKEITTPELPITPTVKEEVTISALPVAPAAEEEIIIPALNLPIEPTTNEESELTTLPQALTPPGNLTLVDDFSGNSAADKQFITVVTRNGFFYIIIDRAGDRQNVHFLNQVDEYDLWAILDEGAQRPMLPIAVESLPEVIQDPEPEPEPEQSGGTGGILIMLALISAVGVGAYYYFRIRPQQGTPNTAASVIDEFIFDEDEEDFAGAGADEYNAEHDGADEDAGDNSDTGSIDDFGDIPDFRLDDEAFTYSDTDSGNEGLSSELSDFGTEFEENESK